MKTKILVNLFSIFMLFGNRAFSQISSSAELNFTTKFEEQIKSVYGLEWVSVNEDAVESLVQCFSTRMSYLEQPLTSNDKYPLLSSFPLMNRNNPEIVAIDYASFDPETFVPITYNLPFFSDLKQVIRVDGTNYIIIIEPITRP